MEKKARYEFGNRIAARFACGVRSKRKALGMSRKELARESLLSSKDISDIEDGRAVPDLAMAAMIADALDATLDILAIEGEFAMGSDED